MNKVAVPSNRQFSVVVTPVNEEDSQYLQDLIYKALDDSKKAAYVYVSKIRYVFTDVGPQKRQTFGAVLDALKVGWMARLPHWSDDVRIVLQNPDENSKMTHPYLYVESRYGRVPWKETFVELLSDSWEIAPYEPLHIEQNCCCPSEIGNDPCDEEIVDAD